jgi:uncharacterized protein (PEP-CTERM system associated)
MSSAGQPPAGLHPVGLPPVGLPPVGLIAAAALVLAPHLAPPARAQLLSETPSSGTSSGASSGPSLSGGSLSDAAPSGGLLPDTGTTAQFGGLRQQLEGLLTPGAGGAPAAPGWTFTPSLSVQEKWTNQSQSGNGQSGGAFITDIRPGILLTGESSRISGTLNYAPDFQFGTDDTQTLIGQNLNAFGHVTAIPEHLFLDLRGFATLQTTNGGYGPNSTVSLGSQNATQSMSFSATPYLRERFGDLASAELGGSLSYTSMQAVSSLNPTAVTTTTSNTGNTGNQDSTTQQEYLSIMSGPQFGRFRSVATISAQQSQGTGVMNGSSSETASVDNGYSVTRDFSLLGKFGYQTVTYSGFPSYHYTGPLWNAGFRWTPNPDSSIEIRYGQTYGRSSALLNASYALTARTRIFARYSEALGTDQGNLANAVNAAVLDPLGNPVDAQTGAPLMLASNLYGVQNNLAWTKSGSLTGLLEMNRDSLAVSISYQDRQQVAAATAGAGNLSDTGTFGSVNWQHNISQATTLTGYVQYGINDTRSNGTTQNSNSLVVSLGLNYAISRTLNASLQGSYTSNYVNQFVVGANQSTPVELVILGIRKTF